MKKVNIFVVCCIAVLVVTSCGSNLSTKEIPVTGADGTVYKSYQTACSKGDFDAARDYIGKLKEQLVVVKAEGDYSEIKAFSELIQEAESYVENEELQYLASVNDEQANNRIILILNQRPIEGLEAAEMACLGKKVDKWYLDQEIDDYTNSSPEEVKNFKRYIIWCGNHNSRCSNILGIAISCGNQSLAKKILHSFRSDPELELKLCKKEKGDVDHYDVYAHYTNITKEAAQKKYDEAVKSGAFN
jgi:hypothetical protein